MSRHTYAVFVVCCLCGCGVESNQLSPEEKFTVDTLYSHSLSAWRASVDSLCNAQKDSIYQSAVDSILKERRSEIDMFFISQ